MPALLRSVWACAEHLEDIPAALAKHRADVPVVDFMMQGALAARVSASTRVALIHSAVAGLVPPPHSPISARWLAAANALRASADLAPMRRLNDAWDPFLTLVTTIAELDPGPQAEAPRFAT